MSPGRHKWESPARVAVASTGDEQSAAAALARELTLPLASDMNDARERFDLLLVVGGDQLELHEARRGAPGPISVDFLGGPVAYRSRSGRSRRQPIALAVGMRSGTRTVMDATAGLGGDAFLLAALGCTVTAVERSPVLAALIRDGLARARVRGNEHLAEIVERIQLVVGDARDLHPRGRPVHDEEVGPGEERDANLPPAGGRRC